MYTVEVATASDNDRLLIFFQKYKSTIVYVSPTSVFFKCPFKGTQAWDIFEFFFYLNQILICPW